MQATGFPNYDGQGRGPINHPHLPWSGTRLSPPTNPAAKDKVERNSRGIDTLAAVQENNKTTGKLAFAAKAVPAGRLFLRRLITLSTKVRCLNHHVRLNNEARADILWWHSFLPTWNGTAAFLDSETTEAHDLELFTDASGTLGCGAYFQGSWFHYSCQPHQRLSPNVSIQWQELFAIPAAALTWGHKWQRKRIKFNCDNQAIVLAWQGKSSKQQRIMRLLRMLFLTAAQHNFTVTLSHLPGRYNAIADALSRSQFTRFFALAPQADAKPTATPGVLSTI